jgi:hypothetical protein
MGVVRAVPGEPAVVQAERRFAGEAAQVRAARRFVAALICDGWPVADHAVLLTSELASKRSAAQRVGAAGRHVHGARGGEAARLPAGGSRRPGPALDGARP